MLVPDIKQLADSSMVLGILLNLVRSHILEQLDQVRLQRSGQSGEGG